MTCDKCGFELHVGDYPFCPHARGSQSVIGDEWPGGKTFENGFESPQTFYSRSEHEAALAARGLEIRAKWAGPADKHLTNWAAGAVDLEGAEAFVKNHYKDRALSADEAMEFPITVTNIRFEKEDHDGTQR